MVELDAECEWRRVMTDVAKVAVETQLSGEAAIAKSASCFRRSALDARHAAINPASAASTAFARWRFRGTRAPSASPRASFAAKEAESGEINHHRGVGTVPERRPRAVSAPLWRGIGRPRSRTNARSLQRHSFAPGSPTASDHPHLTLIRFDAHGGSFWDSPAGLLQVLGAFTKSVVIKKSGKGGESGTLLL